MRLESVVVNGMNMLVPVEDFPSYANTFSLSGKTRSYKALFCGKWYPIQKNRRGYTIKGDKINSALTGDNPFFPGRDESGKKERIEYDAVPGLISL